MTVINEAPTRVQIGLNANGCGHLILMTQAHYEACRENGRSWFCTVCGCQRAFIGKTAIDELRGQLAAAKQREETEKSMRRNLETALFKEQQSKARLKKRIKHGVCPCCRRTFKQLAAHMKTKHPTFKTGDSAGESRG